MNALARHDAIELQELEDLELVDRVRRGDERSLEVLLERYRRFARSKARSYFVAGSEKEDVVQEAMIGLYKAIRDFEVSEETPFRAFAELCISRQILTAIKSANRHKHQPLNTSISLDAPAYNGDDASFVDLLPAETTSDPVELVVAADEIEAMRDSMSETLTKLEADVLRLYIDGRSYEQIAEAVGGHMKAVDNALQRVKRKVQRHISVRNADVLAV